MPVGRTFSDLRISRYDISLGQQNRIPKYLRLFYHRQQNQLTQITQSTINAIGPKARSLITKYLLKFINQIHKVNSLCNFQKFIY